VIVRQVVVPVTPERLWQALTEPDQMAGWFGSRVEWDLTPGGRARFHDDDGRDRAGVVGDVREGRHLQFRWWPEDGDGEASEVTYRLDPDDEGTRLTVTERPVGPQASAAGSPWSPWDSRLAGVWTATARATAGVRA
jgi:uncharacterized protein YndB with AHSA1/START domain